MAACRRTSRVTIMNATARKGGRFRRKRRHREQQRRRARFLWNDRCPPGVERLEERILLADGLGPDLVVDSAYAPPSATLHEIVELSWTVKNDGDQPAGLGEGWWYDGLYLSEDNVKDDSDLRLHSEPITNVQPLAATASYSKTSLVQLPNFPSGDQYLLFATDVSSEDTIGRVDEFDETNNTYAVPLELHTPDVDLMVTNLDVPAEGVAQSNIAFSFVVTNNGSSSAAARWLDGLYLSRNAILDSQDHRIADVWSESHAPLAAGGSYKAEGSARLDAAGLEPGDWYLIAAANCQEQQYEADRENNVLAACPSGSVPATWRCPP